MCHLGVIESTSLSCGVSNIETWKTQQVGSEDNITAIGIQSRAG